jgi:hypothetical protein
MSPSMACPPPTVKAAMPETGNTFGEGFDAA